MKESHKDLHYLYSCRRGFFFQGRGALQKLYGDFFVRGRSSKILLEVKVNEKDLFWGGGLGWITGHAAKTFSGYNLSLNDLIHTSLANQPIPNTLFHDHTLWSVPLISIPETFT